MACGHSYRPAPEAAALLPQELLEAHVKVAKKRIFRTPLSFSHCNRCIPLFAKDASMLLLDLTLYEASYAYAEASTSA